MRRRGRRKLILRSINCIVDFPQGYWFSWMNWRPYSLDKDVYKGSSNIVNDNNFGYVLIDLRRPLEWPHKIALFLRLFGRCHLNILWPNLTSFVTMRGRKRLRSFEATSIVAFSGLNSWILSIFFFPPCKSLRDDFEKKRVKVLNSDLETLAATHVWDERCLYILVHISSQRVTSKCLRHFSQGTREYVWEINVRTHGGEGKKRIYIWTVFCFH